MRVLYKFPSRSRPDKFFAAIDNIHDLSTHDDFEILATLDIDDRTMTTPEVKERLKQYPKVRAIYGTSSGKVSAINRDMDFSGEWQILICMADDMRWIKKGFDTEIISLFEKYFPDTDGFLHLNDGIVNDRLPTMAIMGRKLYDYFGYIYNPIYRSVFCDNEQFDVVRILGKYHYEPINLFVHEHPAYGMAPNDDLYRKNENPELYAADGNTYRQRKEINFGL